LADFKKLNFVCFFVNSRLATKSIEQNENIEAAEKIFAEYGDFIYSVIRFKVSDKGLVDDIYQNFFLSLVTRPIKLEGAKLKAYLYRAIINDIYDAGRKTNRYKDLLNKYFENDNFSINKSRAKNASIVEERVGEIMKKVWDELSCTELDAISLRYIEGHSIKEVAEKMKVKPESVSRYICVGLKKMRERLV
jgi:RNA polymerase sigma factor (sigma-70 family)